jgi:endo-beta-N-acetylglucosaminidase D
VVQLDDSTVKMKAFYYQVKGYQRKGMHYTFYENFQNNVRYFDVASVLSAYPYLQASDVQPIDKLQMTFKENFIKNFKEGESLFYVW